jgi:putative membrane-bound dehydrogenase-like protein
MAKTAINDFRISDPELAVTLWAETPLLFNPTNMDVDAMGRIWVTEGVNYRRSQTRKEGDRVVVLEDTDFDGVADKSTVFIQDPELVAPMGIGVIDNVIFISQTPHIFK